MNIAVLNLKELIKLAIRLMVLVISLIAFFVIITNKIRISDRVFHISLKWGLNGMLKYEPSKKDENMLNINSQKIIFTTAKVRNNKEYIEIKEEEIVEENQIPENKENTIKTIIPKVATTEIVNEKNIKESYTNINGNIKIKNQSNIELSQEALNPDIEITNKKDILIFHTHTCESYTPSDKFTYEMMGNYRTTDENFNMVRVGEELTNYLIEKGFSVVHDKTMHDYPSYTGSYDRSYQTVQNLLYDKDTEIVIDLHRDAVGDGTTYGPKVKINGENAAQLMFVIGTNGSGLEHPNWIQNLKTAIKIQTKANEMYPGLFRPIVIRNSRYNQNLAKGACIIEVGATANTLEEALISMQCLANVLTEI